MSRRGRWLGLATPVYVNVFMKWCCHFMASTRRLLISQMDCCAILVYFISIVPTGLKNTTNKVCFFLVSFTNFIPALPVIFESHLYEGWNDGGAKAVIREAPKKLKQSGWKKTRDAIAVTIRYGYMVILWWDTLTPSIEPGSFVVFLRLQLRSSCLPSNIIPVQLRY